MLAEVDEVVVAHETGGRRRHEHLPTMTGIHHTRREVEGGAEVVAIAQLGFTRVQPNTNWELEEALCSHGCGHGSRCRGEDCAYTIARVLEHDAAVSIDDRADGVVVRGQGVGHRVIVVLPPLRGSLDVGEHERDGSGGKRYRHGDGSLARRVEPTEQVTSQFTQL